MDKNRLFEKFIISLWEKYWFITKMIRFTGSWQLKKEPIFGKKVIRCHQQGPSSKFERHISILWPILLGDRNLSQNFYRRAPTFSCLTTRWIFITLKKTFLRERLSGAQGPTRILWRKSLFQPQAQIRHRIEISYNGLTFFKRTFFTELMKRDERFLCKHYLSLL